MGEPSQEKVYDLAIIGAGPAGLTAALYALRANKSVIIFEGGAFGGTLNIVKDIENYPGFDYITGPQLAEKMIAQVLRFNPDVVKRYVSSVLRDEDNNCFMVISGAEDFKAQRIIYCGGTKRAGLRAAEAFSGEGVSYCAVCDGFFYKNKTVAVVGSGFNAEEDVEYLTPICKKVYLIGDIPKLKGKVEQINKTVAKILGETVVKGIEFKDGAQIEVDGIFIALSTSYKGGIFDALELKSRSIKVNPKTGAVIYKEGKIADNIYVAGDAGADFKQIVWACGWGAKAATDIFKNKK